MILILVLLVFSALISFASAKGEVESMMQQGNDYYQNKQYGKAIESYTKLIDEGYSGTSLFYNLGNSYYREGKIGYAVLYYQKALKLSPGDGDVQHNLAIANTKTVDKINTMPQFFLFQWWESLLAFFPLSGWTYLAYVFYIFLLLSIGIYFFVKNSKLQKYLFFSGSGSLLLLIITSVLLVVNLNRQLNIKNGVVVSSIVNVKVSPDATSNDAFIVHEGLKVREEDSVDNWIKIRLNDGKEGWMPKQDIRTI